MASTYTKKQNAASIKVHQLLLIARDIAEYAGLTALRQDLDHLDQDVQFFHRECNKHRVPS